MFAARNTNKCDASIRHVTKTCIRNVISSRVVYVRELWFMINDLFVFWAYSSDFMLFGVFQVRGHRAFNGWNNNTFINGVFPTCTSTRCVRGRVFSTCNLVVDLTRRLTWRLCLLNTRNVFYSLNVRDRLDYSFRSLVTVSASVGLCTVLRVEIIILRAFFCDVFCQAMDVYRDHFRINLIFFRA